ncbi:MAG: type I-E CRISPR-associated protein Cse2/CasB [Dehalococcoidia bacterium]
MTEAAKTTLERRQALRRRDNEFVRALERLVPSMQDEKERRGDRAALAALRRGLGKKAGEAIDVYPAVYQALGEEQLAPWEEEAYFLVAPLFALYPHGNWRRAEEDGPGSHDLGASFARLAEATDSGSIEKRFQAMLNSNRDDLPEHLRHAVSLLRAHEIPVSWSDLLGDIRAWENVDRGSRRKWARSYWGQIARNEKTAETAAGGPATKTQEEE